MSSALNAAKASLDRANDSASRHLDRIAAATARGDRAEVKALELDSALFVKAVQDALEGVTAAKALQQAEVDETASDLMAEMRSYIDSQLGEAGYPAHEWRGTELRFETSPNVWGPWTDLRGFRGANGTIASVGAGVFPPRDLVLDGGDAAGDDWTLDGGGAAQGATLGAINGGGAASITSGSVFDAGRVS